MRIKEWRNEVVGNVFGFWGCWTHIWYGNIYLVTANVKQKEGWSIKEDIWKSQEKASVTQSAFPKNILFNIPSKVPFIPSI